MAKLNKSPVISVGKPAEFEPFVTIKRSYERGARIQVYTMERWVTIKGKPDKTSRLPMRVHPKDLHLRYGPISRVLYEMAKDPNKTFDTIPLGTTSGLKLDFPYSVWGKEFTSKMQQSLYLLFTAEELLWEGV